VVLACNLLDPCPVPLQRVSIGCSSLRSVDLLQGHSRIKSGRRRPVWNSSRGAFLNAQGGPRIVLYALSDSVWYLQTVFLPPLHGDQAGFGVGRLPSTRRTLRGRWEWQATMCRRTKYGSPRERPRSVRCRGNSGDSLSTRDDSFQWLRLGGSPDLGQQGWQTQPI